MVLRHLSLVQIFYFSFKRSLISVNNSASEGPTGTSSGSSGFLLILLMDLIIRNIKNAMITKVYHSLDYRSVQNVGFPYIY